MGPPLPQKSKLTESCVHPTKSDELPPDSTVEWKIVHCPQNPALPFVRGVSIKKKSPLTPFFRHPLPPSSECDQMKYEKDCSKTLQSTGHIGTYCWPISQLTYSPSPASQPFCFMQIPQEKRYSRSKHHTTCLNLPTVSLIISASKCPTGILPRKLVANSFLPETYCDFLQWPVLANLLRAPSKKCY